MALLYDARGNEFNGNLDALQGVTITDARAVSATLNALNAETVTDLNGQTTVTVQVLGTFTATLLLEGTVDGTNYTALPMFNYISKAYAPAISAATIVTCQIAGFRRVRVRCSAYTSGSAAVSCRYSSGVDLIQTASLPATSLQTVTAAVNTAATLTLAAGGAGVFHYISSIRIEQYLAVAVAAGAAAPLIVTTTNLTGAPAFNFPVKVQGLGEMNVTDIQIQSPLRSTAANTATTIVCPANVATIWRITAAFRLGF